MGPDREESIGGHAAGTVVEFTDNPVPVPAAFPIAASARQVKEAATEAGLSQMRLHNNSFLKLKSGFRRTHSLKCHRRNPHPTHTSRTRDLRHLPCQGWKPEGRRPKEARIPKSELRVSSFGLLSDFDL